MIHSCYVDEQGIRGPCAPYFSLFGNVAFDIIRIHKSRYSRLRVRKAYFLSYNICRFQDFLPANVFNSANFLQCISRSAYQSEENFYSINRSQPWLTKKIHPRNFLKNNLPVQDHLPQQHLRRKHHGLNWSDCPVKKHIERSKKRCPMLMFR